MNSLSPQRDPSLQEYTTHSPETNKTRVLFPKLNTVECCSFFMLDVVLELGEVLIRLIAARRTVSVCHLFVSIREYM
jgi:hypothetical protein